MERVLRRVQATELFHFEGITIMGMSLPVYILVAAITLFAALITGSILGMDRDLLKKAAVRFLPISFISMACAILMAGVMGMITGRGFGDTILYVALPMMSGGMGLIPFAQMATRLGGAMVLIMSSFLIRVLG